MLRYAVNRLPVVRKVRATHLPLPRLLRIFVDNGLVLDDFVEGGVPIPTMLAVQAHRSCSITFATDDMSVSLME